MHGPEILARFLQVPGSPDKYGNRWQYNSRSDRHSKVGSWGVALDLLSTSSTLREHARIGRVVLGVNHTMTDFATFISSVTNNHSLADFPTRENRHRQPGDTERVVQKIKEIPRRSTSSEVGFDGVGITVIDLRNDGSPVNIVGEPPAPQPGDSFHYGSVVVRMAHEYDTTFRGI